MDRKRILIVEDDPTILKVTKLRLEHEGFDVLEAIDGEAALDRVGRELPIHLVLMDVRLPKLNGYELCRRLKQQPATSHIPVIVCSATEAEWLHLADRCIEAGANDWLKKPFRTRELMGKIQRLLQTEGGEHHE